MASIGKYIAYTLSRVIAITSAGSTPTAGPSTPPVPHSLVFPASNPNLKGPLADPQISLYPIPVNTPPGNTSSASLDISLISDTSTSSSDDEHTGILALSAMLPSHPPHDEPDLFSPHRLLSYSSHSYPTPPCTPSPPLLGLGISGLPRKDGKPGEFDGLGVVGIRRSYHTNQSYEHEEYDDDDDDGYVSPTPRRFRGEEEDDGELSATFMQELVYTWDSDPLYARMLTTIPECEEEDEDEDEDEDCYERDGSLTWTGADSTVPSSTSTTPSPSRAGSSSSSSSSASSSTSPAAPGPLLTTRPRSRRPANAQPTPTPAPAPVFRPKVRRRPRRANDSGEPARGRSRSRTKNSTDSTSSTKGVGSGRVKRR